MDIIVSGRHVSITEEMKSYVGAKIQPMLEGKPLKITGVRAVLNVEKNRFIAEVIVRVKNHEFESDVESFDMFESIDAVTEKLEKQITRYVDKAQDHHKRSKATPVVDEAIEELDAELAIYDE
jgi:putative sigma-54 modulation protein